MSPKYEMDSLGVAATLRGMTDEEVRLLVDDVSASGFVKTLQDVSTVLSRVAEQDEANVAQLPMFA